MVGGRNLLRWLLSTLYLEANGAILMNAKIQTKQMITLVLSIMLAIGSYWIPLLPSASIPNPKLLKMVAQSNPVESRIFAREPATAWRFW